jgi:hypothetical protein
MVQNISNSAVVHFFDNLRYQCSKSVAKNPSNRMLGWRNFVDGKVCMKKYLFESSVCMCQVVLMIDIVISFGL